MPSSIMSSATPPTRAALTALLYRPDSLLSALQEMDTTPVVSLDALYVIAARVFKNPMLDVRPLAQVERFVLVAYLPMRLADPADPDMVVTLAHGAAATAFHQTIAAFQEARISLYRDTPQAWYRRVMQAARNLLSPLWGLRPSPAEAVFVLNWAAQTAARGHRIYE